MFTRYRSTWACFLRATLSLLAVAAGTAHAQSSKVAIVTNTFVISGGNFPTTTSGPTGSLASFTFLDMPVTSLSLANLTGGVCGAGCDTVVLSVGTSGLNCNANGVLTATQKAALAMFVQNGGKLIIYDSECPSQNYNWLPYPFTTANPGPEGQTGQLNLVENNALSSSVPGDPKYINEVPLETIGDAVGDANVMTTQHPAWCLDMSATNTLRVTGPVHTYARYGSGLIIYNGLDLDPMNTTDAPNSAGSSPGNLAKIWLQELQVPFNPTPASALPCGIAVIGITLAPLTAINDLGLGQSTHAVTATLTDLLGAHQQGVPVTISITAGPNAGVTTTALSNVAGQVQLQYVSNGTLGVDQIVACFSNQGNQVCSQVATKEWVRQDPSLSLAKTAVPLTYSTPGTVISYSYVVENDGNVPLDGPFSVLDDKATVICPATASLAPGASITCTATYAVTQADIDGGAVTNVASAVGSFNNSPVTSPPATATVLAVQILSLTLDKTATPLTYDAVGNVVSYSYLVTNGGNVTLSGPFTVTDSKATVTCPATPSLAPLASLMCAATYVITQADLDGGTLTNVASARGAFKGTPVTSPDDTATVSADQRPALTVDKTATPATYDAVGNVINYSYVVLNAGNVTLSGPFTVTDSKATVTCPATPSLAPLASLMCAATYTITQADLDGGTVTNVASARGTFNGIPVISPDDTATVGADQRPALTLEKSASPTTYDAVGTIVSYSYLVTNSGNVTLTQPFTVTDDKAADESCPAAATLAPGTSLTCTASYTITQADLDGGTVTNVATARGTFNGNPVTSPVDTATVTAAPRPGLTIDKTATPPTYSAVGAVISYKYVVVNSGNVTLSGAFTVSDDKAVASCPATASLAPQGSITCNANHTITQAEIDAGLLTNVASARATFNGTPVTSPTDTETVKAVPAPRLSLVKAATPPSYTASGQILTFTLRASNDGNTTLHDVRISDPLLGALSCLPAQPATLAPSQSLSCTGTYTVTTADLDAGQVSNTATASALDPQNQPVSQTASATVPAILTPALSLTKTSSPPSFNAVGQTITFTLVAVNGGNATLANVVISDPLLGALNCVPAQPATLAPSQTLTCTGTYVVTAADLAAGGVTNTATVAGDPPLGPPGSVTGQATLTVPGTLSDVLSVRLVFSACSAELQQDWTPRYTTLQFDLWNEDEVKFTGAYECSDGWHETTFGNDFDASRQNFTMAVLGTDTARYRVQAVRSPQCPGSQAVGLLVVQSMLFGQNPRLVGSTLAGSGKFPGFVKWDPPEVVPEGGIR